MTKKPFQKTNVDATLDYMVESLGLDNASCNVYLDQVMSLGLDDIIKRVTDHNVRHLQLQSIICFFINVLLTYHLETLFDFLGAGPRNSSDYKVATLGIAATIMILYNMIAWPHIHEQSEKSHLRSIKSEMGRAQELDKQLDVMVAFISAIMGQIKDMASGGGPEEDEESNYNHGYCRIFDQSNDLMVEARIKQIDFDGKVYGNYQSKS